MASKRIEKVCIANRGEIACRVVRACKKLGLKTVVLYSEPDRDSLAVEMADEAYALGGTSAASSYLQIEKVVAAAVRAGADALHPGYGFLSENADLASACAKAGIVFVGPGPDAIDKMGMKNVARQLVQGLGLPTVPGYDGDDQSLSRFEKEANRIGYPVIIKAAAGGGGKGMQIAEKSSDLAPALESAKRNALSAFGDETVLLERYFPKSKHIEIQVLADRFGKTLHLFERECSVQRRHQKIIEETPSPAVTPALRAKMGEAAVAIAKSVQYLGAGTIEFLVEVTPGGTSENFYFLEMNTRIQVEHAITEEVTGVDLVEWQLRIAMGEAISFDQSELRQTGHAIQCRLYAEDWKGDFLPSTGKILAWNPEELATQARIDHGLRAGDEISVHYDPMIAKVITHGADRSESIRKMGRVLESLVLLGPDTGQFFLGRVLNHPEFQGGQYDTGFVGRNREGIRREWDSGLSAASEEIAIASFLSGWLERRRKSVIPSVPSGWRNSPYRPQRVSFDIEGKSVELSYREVSSSDREVRFEITSNGRAPAQIVLLLGAQPRDRKDAITWEQDGRVRKVRLVQTPKRLVAHHALLGAVSVKQTPRFAEALGAAADAGHLAPMPGKVVKVLVGAGDRIKIGDDLVIIESMKMENRVSAQKAGVIKEIFVAHGQFVEKDDRLVELESGASS